MLQHDKDIDIGIWQDQKVSELIETIRCSGYFYILCISRIKKTQVLNLCLLALLYID